MQIGYARVSTTDQDLTAQRDALLRLGVQDAHIYVDHGMTGANRARPGLREALAAVRSGDTLIVTKLDRLARSLRDAREIADELTSKGVALSLGGNRYDPTDPLGRLLFNVLAMVAEFERDLISMCTREGMAVARAKGRLKGKQPKLSKTQRALLFEVHDRGEYTQTEIAELFSVSRATVYRELQHAVRSSSHPAKRTSSSALGEAVNQLGRPTRHGRGPLGDPAAPLAHRPDEDPVLARVETRGPRGSARPATDQRDRVPRRRAHACGRYGCTLERRCDRGHYGAHRRRVHGGVDRGPPRTQARV
ncbi:recombinase family protein [Microbacterium lushaniae]|nr:recombinase family protein [Microbacterium lushaniae]KAA9149675.1 recombinase family protein [Microbacterium lushaniae]